MDVWGDEHVRLAETNANRFARLLRRPQPANLFLIVGLALMLAGCGAVGDTMTPPRADVSGIQVVAVFPFTNDTSELGLEEQLVQRLVSDLYAGGWYEVVSPERVADELARRRPSPFWAFDDEQWMDMARDVTWELGADGYIVGRIGNYEEDLTVDAPYPVAALDDAEGGTAALDAPPEWRVVQTTEVSVAVTARLVNAHTGDIVHEQHVIGVGRVDDERLLTWALPTEPPASLLPTPHRRDVARARELALQQAFAAFAADILPQLSEAADESATTPADATAPSTSPAAADGTGGD